ncbi:MAG: hypothetical protein U9O24_08310 [Campylobacterota bacterium]|nr:hypothetical protein [Campylobacterota bacterium]
MNKYSMVIMFLTVMIFARSELFPIKECAAFNNMKHSKNTHNITLDIKQKYTVLKFYKGQALILVKGENPSQRWVDEECFKGKKERRKKSNLDNTNKYEELSKNNLLALSWHNAFCETHKYKKECKRSIFSLGKVPYKEKHFVLHGLWPQPRDNLYCNVSQNYKSMDKHKQWHKLPSLGLSSEVIEKLKKVMPGYKSNLHKHEWIKHGTCYGTDANTYYAQAVSLVEQLNSSKVGLFFTKNIGKHVTLEQVRAAFNRSFGIGNGKHVELRCKRGMITELWLHLGNGDDDLKKLLKKGKNVRSRCQKGFIDKAGF